MNTQRIDSYFDESSEGNVALLKNEIPTVKKLAEEEIYQCRFNMSGKVLIAGNGGSCARLRHFCR